MELIGIFSIVLLIGIYFLPTIFAAIRRHENESAIGLTNLLLGWSGIAWIVCLIWAFKNPAVNVSQVNNAPKASTVDELERLGKLRDSGVLTEEEFQAQKTKALR